MKNNRLRQVLLFCATYLGLNSYLLCRIYQPHYLVLCLLTIVLLMPVNLWAYLAAPLRKTAVASRPRLVKLATLVALLCFFLSIVNLQVIEAVLGGFALAPINIASIAICLLHPLGKAK